MRRRAVTAALTGRPSAYAKQNLDRLEADVFPSVGSLARAGAALMAIAMAPVLNAHAQSS